MNNINIQNIKLIIWDLDDTFWQGTISEGSIVPIEKNIKLIKDSTNCGVINSICSKNNEDVCVKKLQELGVSDLFVFKSINWENKAQRIKSQIEQMSLRPANVLFIDDNTFNLQEVKHFLPDIMIAMPDVIDNLLEYFSAAEKTDLKHKRLKQYQLLEQKAEEVKKYDSNEEFLYASNIQVKILNDCQNEISRLHELIIRTNQLNFTKKRITEEELKAILTNSQYKCAYITVSDKFGDYGIVGFYALKDNVLEHFLFSCRTMGQGIEQYVYAKLNFPELEISGEVQAGLKKNFCPAWINQNIYNQDNTEELNKDVFCKILLKGPCDLSKSAVYIKNKDIFRTEFTYVNEAKHNIIEGYNHSVHILGLKEYDEESKKTIIDDCIFVDENMLDGTFFTEKYDIIFLSTVIESGYGIYQKKGTNIQVAFGDYLRPLTDTNNWDDYISGEIYNGHNLFTKEYLEKFSEQYEFIGKTTPEYYIKKIKKILNYLLPETTLCLILGAEYPLENSGDRYKEHIALNDAVKKYANQDKRLEYIEISKIANSRNDFTDTINHFSTRIYYEIAQEMLRIISEKSSLSIESYPVYLIYFDSILNVAKNGLNKVLSKNSFIYKAIRPIYLKISRKKNNIE